MKIKRPAGQHPTGHSRQNHKADQTRDTIALPAEKRQPGGLHREAAARARNLEAAGIGLSRDPREVVG